MKYGDVVEVARDLFSQPKPALPHIVQAQWVESSGKKEEDFKTNSYNCFRLLTSLKWSDGDKKLVVDFIMMDSD